MAPIRKRVSLRQVAQKAGVSVTSASIILNKSGNYAKMSDETIARVRQVAKELGYRPNHAAKALRQRSSMQIGLVIPNIHNSFMQPLILETSKAARDHKYNTILFDMTDQTDDEIRAQLTELQQSANVDGLIIHGMGEVVYDVVNQVPAVYIDSRSCTPSVCYSEEQAGYDLAQVFLTQGLHHIAFIGGDVERESFALRDVEEDLFGYFPISIPGGAAAFNWLQGKEKLPDAAVILTDAMAYGFMLEAKNKGVRIPEDIGVASADDLEMSALFHPSLTCAKVDISTICRIAVDTLFDYIKNGTAPDNCTVPTTMILRRSSQKTAQTK